MRGQSLEVGADLVGGVPRARHPVRADDREVHLAVLHQVPAGIVADDGVRHAVLAQLPRGECRTLVARTGLVHPDVQVEPGIMSGVDRRQRGAPIDGREPAGVAMREDVEALAVLGGLMQDRGAMLADGAVLRHILIGDGGGFDIGCGCAVRRARVAQPGQHAVQRPAQVDGGGPGGGEGECGLLHRVRARVGAERQRQAMRGGGTDQRRAADLHGADGLSDLIQGGEVQDVEGPGQAGLIDDVHGPAIRIEPDGPERRAVDVHGCARYAGGARTQE